MSPSKKTVFGAVPFVLFFALAACSEGSGNDVVKSDDEIAEKDKPIEKDSSENYDEGNTEKDVIAYESEDDVPRCTGKKNGVKIYIVEVSQYRVCFNGEWLIKENNDLENESSSSIAGAEGSSSSVAESARSSSSAEPIILSVASETSPLSEESYVQAQVTADGQGGYALLLTGNIATDYGFITPDYEGDEPIGYQIDSLSFDVGWVDENGNTIRVGNLPISLKSNFQFPKERISLISAIDEIPLDQNALGCGEFVLYVNVYMSGDTEETKNYLFMSRLEADFELPCEFEEKSSSSVAEVCTQVDSVAIVLSNVSTQSDAGQAINFNTGTANNPHVTMSIVDNTGYLVAGNGVTFQQITFYNNSVIWAAPTAPVCLEKFSYSASFDEPGNSATKVEMREISLWYMAITPDGNFPIRPTRVQTAGSEGTIYFIYYKKTN